MSDSRIDRVCAYGTDAARLAFIPDPPPNTLVIFFAKDTKAVWLWDVDTSDWTPLAAGLGGLPVRMVTAGVALTAGNFVNLYTDTGALRMRLADADNANKPADGFVLDNVGNGDDGLFYPLGFVNDQLAGLTPGGRYWLSTVAGGVVDSTSIPVVTDNGQQQLGVALSATELLTQQFPINTAP